MHILLVDDDGIMAKGLNALALHLKQKGHRLTIVAPDGERSGASHSLTLTTPLRATPVKLEGLEDMPAYAVNGTPVDCVKLAFGNLVKAVDIVISGINIGPNLGTDVFYSGTVSAAMEGVFNGCPAIAVSNAGPKKYDCFSACCQMAELAMELIKRDGRVQLLNVNVPNVSAEELRGHKFTSLSKQTYELAYDERTDPRQKTYYWTPVTKTTTFEKDDDNDERWTSEGYASITPLLADLTDKAEIIRLKEMNV